MKKKLLLMFALALLVPWATRAQVTVEIGNASSTTTQYALPVNMYFNYSLTQQLFTAEEIGTAGNISAISFEYTNTAEFSMNSVQVYMKNVSKTSFTSTTDMEPISSSDLVWTGTFSATASGWVTINLDSPFAYDGTSNLLVCFYDPTSGYPGSAYKFRTTSTGSDYLAMAYYSDSYTPSITDVSSFSGTKTRYQYRSNIQLEITAGTISCYPVKNLSVADVTAESMTLHWMDTSNTAATYRVYSVTSTDTTLVQAGISDSTFTVTGLNANTVYRFGVMTDCGAGDSASMRYVEGRTACSLLDTLPYIQDFENEATTTSTSATFIPCWGHLNNGTTYFGIPYLSSTSTYNHTSGGSKGLYWNNSTTTGTYGDYQCIVFPGVDNETFEISDLMIRFWAKGSATTTRAALQVGVMTDPTDITTFVPVTTVNVAGNDWVRYQALLSSYTGEGQYVAIKANRASWTIYVDDMELMEIPGCFEVTNLRASATTSSAILSWDASISDPECSAYVQYKVDDTVSDWSTSVTAEELGYVITGLTPGTAYLARVAALCSNGEQGDWVEVGFNTARMRCAVIDLTQADSISIGAGTTNTYYVPVGNLYKYSYTQQLITADELDNSPATITGIDFEYGYTSGMTKSNVTIYMANTTATSLSSAFVPYDAAAFVKVWHDTMQCTQGWNHFEFTQPFSYDGNGSLLIAVIDSSNSYPGSSYVFKAHSATGKARYVQNDSNPYNIASPGSGNSYANRNNMKIHIAGCSAYGSCATPAIAVTEITSSTLTVAIAPGASESGWEMYKRAAGETLFTLDGTASGTSYTFTELLPGTEYELMAQHVCDGDTFATATTAFTVCASLEELVEDFNSYSTGSSAEFNHCWVKNTTSSTNYPYVNTVAGEKAMYFYAYNTTSGTPNYSWLVTPAFSVDINTLSMEFDMRRSSSTVNYLATVAVGVMTDPNDISTFDTVALISAENTSVWESKFLSLADYEGEGSYIAFMAPLLTMEGQTAVYTQFYFDNLHIGNITCPRFTQCYARNITATEAEVVWDNSAVYSGAVVKWSTINDPAAATDSVLVSEGNSYLLTGLAPDSVYYCWVYAQCAEGNNLPRSFTFQTAPACGQVENLSVVDIFSTTATLTWDANELADVVSGYKVKVYSDSAVFADTIVTNTYCFLADLEPLTNYNVQVLTLCSDQDSSLAATTTFRTADSSCAAIGSGTSTMTTAPTNTFYKYTYSQIIWTADELSRLGDTIRGITFPTADTLTRTRTVVVYMGQTTQDGFASSGASYLPISGMTQVFSGTVTITPGTFHITFDTAFVRDRNSNLVLALDDNTGSYVSTAVKFAATTTANRMVVYRNSDSENFDPANPSSTAPTSTTSRPNVVFDADCSADCPTVSLVCSDATATTVDLVWNGPDENYRVEYAAEGDTTWTLASASIAASSYTVTGLQAATRYLFRVGFACTDADTVYGYDDIYTGCETFTVPYTENFNNIASGNTVINPCWTLGNNRSATSTTPSIVNITNNGHMVVLPMGSYIIFPEFDQAVNTLQLRLSYLAARTDIYTLVGICSDPTDINSMVVIDTLWAETAGEGTWATVGFGDYEGSEGYIAILSNYNQAYIDNVNIELLPMCGTAVNQAYDNVTTNSVDISWEAGTNASRYLVDYYKVGDTVVTTIDTAATAITLTGLDHSTTYRVEIRTVCASLSDTSLATNPLTFTTNCAPVDLPYVQDFDHCNAPALTYTGILPNCWNYDMIATGTYATGNNLPQIYSDNSYAHSGHYSLRLYGKAVVTLPEMPVDVDTLMISLHDYNSSISSYALEIGVCDSNWGDFAASFVPVDTIIATQTHTDFSTFRLSRYTGTGRYIAFRNYYRTSATTQYSGHYLDDIVVDYLPSCLPVLSVHSEGTTADGVWLNWTDYRPATAWQVAYSTTPLNDSTLATASTLAVTSKPFLVSGLSDTVTYYFYVRTDCGGGDYSEWSDAIMARPNTWNMRPGQTDTVYMCGGTIYDDGGANGNYSLNQSASIVVIMPSDSNDLVMVNGRSRTEGSWDYLRIYDGAGTTGTILWQDNTSGVSSWQTFEDIISTTGPLTLYFHSDGSTVYEGFECNVSCLHNYCPVDDVAVDSAQPMTSNAVTLTWTGSSTSYQIEYGPAGFVRDSGTFVTTTTNSYTFSDLAASTSYDFYVRGFCNEGDTGLWADLTYKTPMCDALNYAAVGSESSTSSGYVFPANNLWKYSLTETIIDSAELGGPRDIEFVAFYYTGSSPMTSKPNVNIYLQPTTKSFFDGTAPTSSTTVSTATTDAVPVDSVNAVLVYSGPINPSEQGWNYFSFITPYHYNGVGNLLMIVDDNSNSYTSSHTFKYETTPDSTFKALSYHNDSENPDAFNPASFSGTGKYRYRYRVVMRLGSCGMACEAPVILGATATETTATVTFVGETNTYELAIVEGAWTDSAVSAANIVPFTGLADTLFHIFTDLTANTTYTIGVRTVCGSNRSEWVTESVTTDEHPCYMPTELAASDVTITSATLGWTIGEAETEWMVNLTSTVASVDTTFVASTNPVTLTGLTPKTPYMAKIRAICSTTQQSDWTEAITFTTDSCRRVATAPTVSGITSHSAVITWAAGSNSNGNYQIDYGYRGITQGSGTRVEVTGATTYTIDGLLDGTAYDVYVRSMCATGVYSAWSPVGEFTTQTADPDECNAPTGVAVNNITANSAIVTWTGTAAQYEVEYGVANFDHGTGTVLIANSTSQSLTGLTANTAYDVYVRSICANGNMSDWSAVKNFTTSEAQGIDDVNGSAVVLYPNPATVNVTISGIEGQATVTIVDLNGRESGKWNVENGEITIDVSDMAKGAYFVRIVGEQSTAIRKLVIR